MYKYWTKDDQKSLIDLYPTAKMCDMMQLFGRGERSIHVKASRLGIKRDKSIGKLMESINGYVTVSEYSEATGIPVTSVYNGVRDRSIKSVKIGNFIFIKP